MCTEEEERGREGGREGGRDGWFSSGIGQTYTTRHVRMSDADIRSTLHYAQFTRKWLFRMTRSPQHTHTHTHTGARLVPDRPALGPPGHPSQPVFAPFRKRGVEARQFFDSGVVIMINFKIYSTNFNLVPHPRPCWSAIQKIFIQFFFKMVW